MKLKNLLIIGAAVVVFGLMCKWYQNNFIEKFAIDDEKECGTCK